MIVKLLYNCFINIITDTTMFNSIYNEKTFNFLLTTVYMMLPCIIIIIGYVLNNITDTETLVLLSIWFMCICCVFLYIVSRRQNDRVLRIMILSTSLDYQLSIMIV
jgi:uncharacterized membrane protein YdjX (TVP38/TMEM64 family)